MSLYALEGPKWTTKTITWSFADLRQPNSASFTGTIGAAYQAIVRSAVATWDDVVNLTFVEVPDSTPGVDIRIGWSEFGTGQQVGQTDYAYTAGSTEAFIAGTDVRLEDPAQLPLSTGASPQYRGTTTGLYQVALHELGHALGLDHSTDTGAIMYPSLGPANPGLSTSDLAGIHQLYDAPGFAMTDTATGLSNHPDGAAYTGPLSTPQQQLVYSGPDAVAISASIANVYLQGGSGAAALAASAGQNVIQGGQASNFLVGGSGTDQFVLDLRRAGPTWDTLVNFHAGDQLTIWGFDPATSTQSLAGTDGAPGYTGLTLHLSSGANGPLDCLTFAGLSSAATLSSTSGSNNGTSFLLITSTA